MKPTGIFLRLKKKWPKIINFLQSIKLFEIRFKKVKEYVESDSSNYFSKKPY